MRERKFTRRCQAALSTARAEAARAQSQYVGTEHVLAGLLRERQGVAVMVLESMRVDLSQLQRAIENVIAKGSPVPRASAEVAYSVRATRVIDLAVIEARELCRTYVDTEHLLFGILRDEVGVAAKVLTRAGVSLDAARTVRIQLPDH